MERAPLADQALPAQGQALRIDVCLHAVVQNGLIVRVARSAGAILQGLDGAACIDAVARKDVRGEGDPSDNSGHASRSSFS